MMHCAKGANASDPSGACALFDGQTEPSRLLTRKKGISIVDVLVVEDDHAGRDLLTMILENRGVQRRELHTNAVDAITWLHGLHTQISWSPTSCWVVHVRVWISSLHSALTWRSGRCPSWCSPA